MTRKKLTRGQHTRRGGTAAGSNLPPTPGKTATLPGVKTGGPKAVAKEPSYAISIDFISDF